MPWQHSPSQPTRRLPPQRLSTPHQASRGRVRQHHRRARSAQEATGIAYPIQHNSTSRLNPHAPTALQQQGRTDSQEVADLRRAVAAAQAEARTAVASAEAKVRAAVESERATARAAAAKREAEAAEEHAKALAAAHSSADAAIHELQHRLEAAEAGADAGIASTKPPFSSPSPPQKTSAAVRLELQRTSQQLDAVTKALQAARDQALEAQAQAETARAEVSEARFAADNANREREEAVMAAAAEVYGHQHELERLHDHVADIEAANKQLRREADIARDKVARAATELAAQQSVRAAARTALVVAVWCSTAPHTLTHAHTRTRSC